MSLTSSSDITVVSGETMSAVISLAVLPSLAAPYGQGKLAHPILGTFEYEYKPDQYGVQQKLCRTQPMFCGQETLKML
jgi:hypothetical protein